MILINYSIEFQTPFRVGTGMGQAGFIDNTTIRNRDGLAYIPGSTIKGRARAAALKLAPSFDISTHSTTSDQTGCLVTQPDGPCAICRIFGAPQWPGMLSFEKADLHGEISNILKTLDLHETPIKTHAQNYGRLLRTGIGIDRKLRVVVPDRLFTNECVGTKIPFTGRIIGEFPSSSPIELDLALLLAALKSISHLGGGRGRGLGRCEFTFIKIQVDGKEKSLDQLISSLAGGGLK
ncbi:hypothetical protein ADN00_12975 [Ornatilinea apprima]|uniref:CRISPR type III-associated protein domain-containing protein n=1 Tax=Ornatilinea apprima TaxID=1134406 RepID=A0A0N8GMH3_9CHLR|nr:RAMP superfamily CRISPR-associated protein [Ornatilinea apprima]KPL75298.1 hypothetical protein ADN00_12975 [Ornatilinea apprima]